MAGTTFLSSFFFYSIATFYMVGLIYFNFLFVSKLSIYSNNGKIITHTHVHTHTYIQ